MLIKDEIARGLPFRVLHRQRELFPPFIYGDIKAIVIIISLEEMEALALFILPLHAFNCGDVIDVPFRVAASGLGPLPEGADILTFVHALRCNDY